MVTTKYGIITFSCSCKLAKVEFKCSISSHLPSEKTIRPVTLNNPCDIFLHLSATSTLNPTSAQEHGIFTVSDSAVRPKQQTSICAPLLNAPEKTAQEKTQLRNSSARATSAIHWNNNQKVRIMQEERGKVKMKELLFWQTQESIHEATEFRKIRSKQEKSTVCPAFLLWIRK